MNNDKLENLINKGVPIDTPFLLSINLLKSFCNDQEKLNKCVQEAVLKFGKFLSEIGLENYLFYSFAFQIISDQNSLEKKIYFSPRTIPLTLIYSLIPQKEQKKYKDKLFDSEEEVVYETLLKRIDKLRRIKKKNNLSKEQVLSMEFPALYKVFLANKNAIQYLISLAEKYSNGKISKEKYIELRDEFIDSNPGIINTIYDVVDYYISTGVKKEYSVTKFCNDYADFFEKMIDSVELFDEYFYSNPLSLDDIVIDKERFELYLAIKNAIAIIEAKDSDKQRYAFYLANYFKEDSNRQTSLEPVIQIEELGDTLINPFSVYQLYTRLLIENPDIKPLTFNEEDFEGMNSDEVKEFINNLLETFSANWDVIPLEEVERSGLKHDPSDKKDDIDRRIELFMEKHSFYGSLSPIMSIRGKKTFDGYVGYIFSNGMVVLDKFYQNYKKGVVSKGDAIYCMRIEDFYRLSQFPKSILRKDSNVISIVHRKGWQEKVLEVIKQKGNGIETEEEVNKLLNKNLVTKK